MFPQFELFGYNIGLYGLISVIGCIISGFLLCKLLKRKGVMTEDSILFLLTVIGGVIIGGHVLYALTNIRLFSELFKSKSLTEFARWLTAIFGGSVFYGGLFGGIASGCIASKFFKHKVHIYADVMSPIIPLFHGIARIGCFFAGCCYGIESKFGFYTDSNEWIPSINGVVRFPIQLLESVCNFVLSAILFFLLKKSENSSRLRGKLLYIYLISYGVIRFLDEFLRGDEVRGFVWIFSTSQLISLISVCISFILLIKSTYIPTSNTSHPE